MRSNRSVDTDTHRSAPVASDVERPLPFAVNGCSWPMAEILAQRFNMRPTTMFAQPPTYVGCACCRIRYQQCRTDIQERRTTHYCQTASHPAHGSGNAVDPQQLFLHRPTHPGIQAGLNAAWNPNGTTCGKYSVADRKSVV